MQLVSTVYAKKKNILIAYFPEVQSQTSQYIGVSWFPRSKKWKVTLAHKRKKYHGGYCDNEKHAAMKVNLLCDTFGIERRNPTIDIKLDAMRKVTLIVYCT